MSNKITFTDAYELLTEQEYALLQKGIFLGMDAHQKTVKFCSGLKMNQDDFSFLLNNYYTYSSIARTVCLLGLVATKGQDCNNFLHKGLHITIRSFGTNTKNCSVSVDNVQLIKLIENSIEGGWDIVNILPDVIGANNLFKLLLEATLE